MSDPSETVQLAVFRLGEQRHAMDVMRIHQILRYAAPTPLPRVTGHGAVVGLLRHRGEVLPVVDLRERLGLPQRVDRTTRMVVSRVDGTLLALVVDEVLEVIRRRREDIRPAEAVLGGPSAMFLGVCQDSAEHIVLLLNLHHVIAGAGAAELAGLAEVPSLGGAGGT